jgi:hypothetical protein
MFFWISKIKSGVEDLSLDKKLLKLKFNSHVKFSEGKEGKEIE